MVMEMKSEFEGFVNELKDKIENLNEFDEVDIGVKPAVDRNYICLLIPDEAVAEHNSPYHIVWRFYVSIYVFKTGNDLWGALEGIDKIIKMIEADLSVNGTIDTVTYNRITIEGMEERSGAALQLIGRRLIKEA